MRLPFGARITPDPDTKSRLLANLNEQFSKPRPEIHVSDLVYCLRQSVYRKLTPKPNGERELSFFSAGRGHHGILQGLHGSESEVERVWQSIQAHFDLLDKVPIEIKTTRSFRRDVKPHWIKQLAYYLAIENSPSGKLIVLYLFPRRDTKENPATSPDLIETYEVAFQNLHEIRQDLLKQRDLLQKALDARNPALAPAARGDPDNSWLCRNCQFRIECDSLEAASQ